jgi:beta-galactosidase/beta-glucuronidase
MMQSAGEFCGGLGYPRPQFRRHDWFCLNGTWDFSIDPLGIWHRPSDVVWRGRIEVPFAPETERSGVEEKGFFRACWYRRMISALKLRPGERCLLHFGAVDYVATVWVNGCYVGQHEGGYTPFSFDVTDVIEGREASEIVVQAVDVPDDLQQPRGKQDWQLVPHLIWYPRTSGIWQTVWLERVPHAHIAEVLYTPNLSRWEIGLYIRVAGHERDGKRVRATLKCGNQLLAEDLYSVTASEVHRRIALSDPGIDDSRNALLWSPGMPTLIDVRLELLGKQDEVLDVVDSYTALREVAIQGDRITLNGRALELRFVLDQGYWPGTGLTAPDDASLRRDVQLAKDMGFNGVRKHQKIEDPRYLYWADTLGLLVWEEMPSAYRFTRLSVERLKTQWEEVLRRDYNHPCIVGWVPFNESWGVPNLPENVAERHYVQALYHLTKTIDPTRPVVGNDGWESVATDIIGIHDYDDQPTRMARRYETTDLRVRLFQHERPGGRLLMLQGQTQAEHPIVLSEFGGIALDGDRTWGYSRSSDAEDFEHRYTELLRVVHGLQLLAGFCYTQFADTYQEANGLLYFDRRPKFPLERMRIATRGRRSSRSPRMPGEPIS